MRFNGRASGVQRRQEFLAFGLGDGVVVAGEGDEAGWEILWDAVAGGAGVHFRLGRLRAQEVAVLAEMAWKET
jgi:hypothetical protein